MASEAPQSERFRFVSRLGEGAYGTVYEAIDLVRDERVAVKVLHRLGADALFRFKQELRALRDLHHPNLVELGELIERGGRWMFTMELVGGTDWLSHVRPRPSHAPLSPGVPDERPATRLDEGRLRDALRQLASGLLSLHRAGHVHRDIKPSNVRVDPRGRVVLLDFGLVTGADDDSGSAAASMVGTAAYMSPEQAASGPVSPASDWYAVGVLLYEALTGRRPFTGPALQVLFDKRSQEPPPPSVLSSDLPADLEELCCALLRVDPAQRPGGEDVLRTLGLSGAGEGAARAHIQVGRERELQRLLSATEAAVAGQSPAHVYVAAEAGLGKSSLLRRWHEAVQRRHPDVLLLRGGSHSAEAVPFRAVDGVVDGLSRALRHSAGVEPALSDLTALGALCAVFPVLGRVPSLACGLSGYEPPADPRVERHDAFGALRELFGLLGRRGTVVLCLDDLDGADAESLELLEHLLAAPAPPLWVVAAGAAPGRCRPVVRHTIEQSLCPRGAGRLSLSKLSLAECESLAQTWLEGEGPAWGELAGEGLAAAIAARAEGHPVFVQFLVRYGHTLARDSGSVPTLTEALRHRVASFEADERELLCLLALADGPLPLDLLRAASGLSGARLSSAAATLRNSALVGQRGAGEDAALVIAHDRLREAISCDLDVEARQQRHRRIAEAYLALEVHDAEALALHLRAAGDTGRAADFASIAAGAAMDAFAFERAARLYRVALDLCADGKRKRRLWVRYADALAGSGDCAEASAAYLEAVPGAAPLEAAELRTWAAQQLMQTGDVSGGLRQIRTLLRGLHVGFPKGRRGALASLLFQRARLRLRGLSFQRREATWISPEVLHEVDLLWCLTNIVTMADTVRGADFHTRHVVRALEAGEPYRLARAFAMEAQFLQSTKARSDPAVTALFAQARLLSEESGNAHAHAVVSLAEGGAAHSIGRFTQAHAKLEEAERILRRRCRGVGWELAMVHYQSALSLMYMGRFRDLEFRVQAAVGDARERGDRYLEALMGMTAGYWNPLLEGDASGARALLEDSLETWRKAKFHSAEVLACIASTYIALAADPAAAHEAHVSSGAAVDAQTVARVPSLRVLMRTLQAQSRLATESVRGGVMRGDVASHVERAATALRREALGYAPAFGALLAAAVASHEGDPMRAISLLNEAANGFHAHGMGLYASASRYREGLLLGGEQGREQVSLALSWASAHGPGDPCRLLAAASPGFPDG